jgi:hypothetical protein
VLYFLAGASAWFVYLLPESEGGAILLGAVVSIWQGILLWKGKPQETQTPGIAAEQPDQV